MPVRAGTGAATSTLDAEQVGEQRHHIAVVQQQRAVPDPERHDRHSLDRVGRLDEAVERYTRVVATCRRMGSRRTAVALVGLGEVHRRRAWREQARAAYEEGLRVARASGEIQSLVPGLAGLARVLAPDDPVAATGLADEAAQRAQGSLIVAALGAKGWVAIAAGDPGRAAELAEIAVRQARYRREPRWLAEALELRAAAEPDPSAARAALVEAHAIWHHAGAVLDADRILATLAGLPGAGSEDRLAGLLARQRQAAAGVAPDAATLPLLAAATGPGRVQVLVLGRFEVRVGDRPVAATAWQSRKARDLLRILVARRARVMPREELAEALWPEDDPGRTGHRLSVLLSILRTVLDPDRSAAIDQFVIAERSGIALDPTWVRIDVEEFLVDVAHGCRRYEQGSFEQAESVLAAATSAYAGDPFDDEPYADWTAPLREQARAAHLRALRTLARLARHDGDTDRVVAHLLAILERDPYDEEAHRAMVVALASAGRHGEARRAHTRYRDAMRTIGAPAPDESLLVGPAPPR